MKNQQTISPQRMNKKGRAGCDEIDQLNARIMLLWNEPRFSGKPEGSVTQGFQIPISAFPRFNGKPEDSVTCPQI